MKRIHSGLVVALLAAAVVWAAAPPSPACSVRMPPTLDEIVDTRLAFDNPVTGVFEIEHIAYAPNFGLRTARSVSIVTRYWGEPPPDRGRVSHGEFWLGGGSSCGNGNGSLGEVQYSWTDGVEENRGQFSGITTGRQSARAKITARQEAALTAAFGPPVEVPPSAVTRSVAWAQIWWLPTLLGLALGVVALFPLRRHMLTHSSTARERFSWYPLAVGTMVATAIPAMNRLHEDFSLDITPLGSMIMLGTVAAATALSPTITGWVVGAVWIGLANRIVSEYGEFPFRGLNYSGLRLSDGLVLTLLGLGVLVVSGRHWARWIGMLALATGSAALASSLWPLAGHISWWIVTPTTLVVTGLALWFGAWVGGLHLDRATDDRAPAPTE
jgi:hypothetical protein